MKILNPYIEVPVDQIKPDPHQPRKYFSQEKIDLIAATINSNIEQGKTGIINPIELDQNYILITGEYRWRAAKQAGLKTIPAKVIETSENERYWRQGVENWSRQDMTHIEVSDWMMNVLQKMGWKPKDSSPGLLSFEDNYGDKHVISLAKKLGVSKSTIYDHLKLQLEKENVKEFLKENNERYSLVKEVNKARVEPEVKEKLKEKIIDSSLKDRQTTDALVTSIRHFPEKSEALLQEDYKESPAKNTKKIGDIENTFNPNAKNLRLGHSLVDTVIELQALLNLTNLRQIAQLDKNKTINMARKIIEQLEAIIKELSDDKKLM